jgi:hypothetical protein
MLSKERKERRRGEREREGGRGKERRKEREEGRREGGGKETGCSSVVGPVPSLHNTLDKTAVCYFKSRCAA